MDLAVSASFYSDRAATPGRFTTPAGSHTRAVRLSRASSFTNYAKAVSFVFANPCVQTPTCFLA